MPQGKFFNQKGFTLLEIIVVLVIIGMFIGFGATQLANRDSKTKTAVRRFVVLGKKTRNKARVHNKTYRLVFDLPIDRNKEQSYWLESTDKKALLLDAETREELEEAVENDDNNRDKKELPDPQGFTLDNSLLKKAPASLPDGLYFDSIELDGDPIQIFENGRVYIYFFPQGSVQTAAIHITDREDKNWTIAFQGVTGRVDVFPDDVSLKELKDE